MTTETPSNSALIMDRGIPLGNSEDLDGRRSLHVKNMLQLVTSPYDSGTVEYPSPTSEIYKFRQGGVSGTIVATVTLIYTDATKALLSSWAKT